MGQKTMESKTIAAIAITFIITSIFLGAPRIALFKFISLNDIIDFLSWIPNLYFQYAYYKSRTNVLSVPWYLLAGINIGGNGMHATINAVDILYGHKMDTFGMKVYYLHEVVAHHLVYGSLLVLYFCMYLHVLPVDNHRDDSKRFVLFFTDDGDTVEAGNYGIVVIR
eukprot:TRINITY_DN594_c0_g1_i2.p1 TRINITY_DN594_c0_g1~~TRINITY_DN594_c0_g1_i2.p1  ORF type:complete len:167 (+),score=12.19 TRINITY_DN594_c0_g1_i2:296-796(+)